MGVYFSREIPNQLIFGIFSFFQGVFGGRQWGRPSVILYCLDKICFLSIYRKVETLGWFPKTYLR